MVVSATIGASGTDVQLIAEEVAVNALRSVDMMFNPCPISDVRTKVANSQGRNSQFTAHKAKPSATYLYL